MRKVVFSLTKTPGSSTAFTSRKRGFDEPGLADSGGTCTWIVTVWVVAEPTSTLESTPTSFAFSRPLTATSKARDVRQGGEQADHGKGNRSLTDELDLALENVG